VGAGPLGRPPTDADKSSRSRWFGRVKTGRGTRIAFRRDAIGDVRVMEGAATDTHMAALANGTALSSASGPQPGNRRRETMRKEPF
jgi:hypothetical protein